MNYNPILKKKKRIILLSLFNTLRNVCLKTYLEQVLTTLYVLTDIWPYHKSMPESNGLTNRVGSVSPGPRPPEVSDGEKEVNSEFKQPLNALVQNCTMLHNIVGPACIFLRQGFSQARLVCMQKSDLIISKLTKTPRQPFASSCEQTIMEPLVMPSTIIFIQYTLNHPAQHLFTSMGLGMFWLMSMFILIRRICYGV